MSAVADARWGWLRPQAIDVAGLACLLGYGVLAWSARTPHAPMLTVFLCVAAWTALATFALYFWQGRRDEPLSVARLMLWAVAFRVCGLIGGPVLEDDVYRYLWDGYRFAVAGTPFGVAPEQFFQDMSVPETFRHILSQINNPDLATFYAPVTQVVFLLGYLVAPGQVAGLQVIFILLDIGVIALLLRLAPARAVLLYAWCPLAVKEIAFTAHPESIGIALLLVAFMLARREQLKVAAICLGLAIGAKVFAAALVPFVLRRGRFIDWALCAGVAALVYLPFALSGDAGSIVTATVFAFEWEFNAAAFELLRLGFSELGARLVGGGLLLALIAWLYWREREDAAQGPLPVPRGDWVFGAVLLLAPVINPWYFLWVAVFAVVYPSLWAWTASVALLLSYIIGLHLQDFALQPYEHPVWVRPLEFGIIAAALAGDFLMRRRARANIA